MQATPLDPAPAVRTTAGINASANLDFGVARAGVGGGVKGTAAAFLEDPEQ